MYPCRHVSSAVYGIIAHHTWRLFFVHLSSLQISSHEISTMELEFVAVSRRHRPPRLVQSSSDLFTHQEEGQASDSPSFRGPLAPPYTHTHVPPDRERTDRACTHVPQIEAFLPSTPPAVPACGACLRFLTRQEFTNLLPQSAHTDYA